MKKVLIVDDSVSMRQMVSFTLREGGFEVIEAEHGQDALDKLQGAAVDLVITDLNMPVMDGITLIQKTARIILAHAGHGLRLHSTVCNPGRLFTCLDATG